MRKSLIVTLFAALCVVACGPENKPEQTSPFPDHNGYRIYAVDNTGWSTLALYMYGTVNDLGGSWPGMRPTGKTTIQSTQYVYFDIDQNKARGCTEKLIFNNTSGTQIKNEPSLTFSDKADYFFTVTATGATPFDGGSTLTIQEDNSPVTASAKKTGEAGVNSGAEFYRIYQVNPKLYPSPRLSNIKARIPTIKALGTDILYLMPIYPEGTTKAVGSPYCVKDFRGVNSSYGSMSDLKDLVDAAHGAGMKVIFDWVANHTSWDCEWTSTHKDWYKKDASGNIVYPTADGAWADVAQLDYSSSALRAEMTDCMLYWVRELGIDGYRCDYAHGPEGQNSGNFDIFWKEAITSLRTLKPGFIMLAESDYNKMFSDGFDMNYSRPVRGKLISSFASGDAEGLAASILSELGKAATGHSKLMFETNHDEASIKSPLQELPGKKAVISGLVLLSALPASTLIYGSQETAWDKAIDFCRFINDFNWNADEGFRKELSEALSKVDSMKRGSKLTIYSAGPAIILVYTNGGTLAVNLGRREVNATLQSGVTIKLGAYEFSVLDS